MTEPMMITDEMKNSRQQHIDEIVAKLNKDIEIAIKRGEHECLFWCSYYASCRPFCDEVRSLFRRAGYGFTTDKDGDVLITW